MALQFHLSLRQAFGLKKKARVFFHQCWQISGDTVDYPDNLRWYLQFSAKWPNELSIAHCIIKIAKGSR